MAASVRGDLPNSRMFQMATLMVSSSFEEGIFAALMHGDQVETCASCGRYLYLPKVPAQEMPQARSEASLLSSAKNA